MKIGRVALAAVAGMALTLARADVKQEMKELGARAEKAFAAKDAATLINMLDEKFVWKHCDGRPNENKKQAGDGLKAFFAMADSIKITFKDKSIVQKGNVVTLVSEETMECTMKPGQDKKVHKMKSVNTSKETWVKTAKGWKATMFEDLPGAKVWMDGKPFDMKKAKVG
jgi:ketosteroid isomerase-like protein